MPRFLLKFIIGALALWAATKVVPGVTIDDTTTLLIAALLLGIVNAIVRPILIILTFPLTLVTLGLFLFVINALLFWAASGLLPGLHVNSFFAALVGSLIYSLLGLLIESALGGLFSKQA